MQRSAALIAAAAVLLASLALQAEALTAFGKSNSPDKDTKPTPKVPKGRICNGHADCAGTGTTCQLLPADGKKHCLCKDGTPPINAKCAVVPVAPGKSCKEHSDCVPNAECAVANTTTSNTKTCNCKDGFDVIQDLGETLCSGSSLAAVWPCLTLFLALFVVVLAEPRPSRRH
ncbi:Prolow-density lipoprotein receptor-related protein 1 [Frankliniella fusca]|uniref:Prolow-density lipoprotein receptor-related protein 1 n=1 Tax=Frankliniella fusca TaxID=407009 RepID=A0AAE1LKC3_9NEOP|nr:Prolow-density lipoprotein receptor-related protein 1 [Frankliniella fusca]